MIESIRKFMMTCPLLDGAEVNVNYLAPEPRSFAVDNISAPPVVKRYSDGGCIRQFCFAVACRDAYDRDEKGNSETAQLFEKLAAWIEEQDLIGNYPDITGIPVGLEVTGSAALENTDGFTARTSMQARLLYRQK
ncbi:MAG: hypothetical protein PUE13_05400 [Clostridiales bacterium]|nr:hypothetical protein [Clostridiales bacterium]